MTDQRLKAAQAVSGAVFGAFLLLHLVNQALAVAGASAYDAMQLALRPAPVLELALVLLPLAGHVGLAIASMLRRRGKAAPVLGWPARLHRWSGRFLLLFIVGHVGATRLPQLLADAAPGFAGVAFTFKWIPLWFWPYYPLLALAGWYHLLFGLGVALPQLGVRWASRLLSPRVLTASFALGAVALLAGVVAFGVADASVMQSPYARFWLNQ